MLWKLSRMTRKWNRGGKNDSPKGQLHNSHYLKTGKEHLIILISSVCQHLHKPFETMTRRLSYNIKNSMTQSSLVHSVSLIQLFVLIVFVFDTLLRIIFNPTISLIINVPPRIREWHFKCLKRSFYQLLRSS